MNFDIRPIIKLTEPNINQLHVSVPLSNLANSIAAEDDEFIADQISPAFPVNKITDSIWKMDVRSMFRRGGDRQGPKGYLPEIHWLPTRTSYLVERFGVSAFISDVKENNADEAVKPSRDFARIGMRQCLIDYEVRVLTAATTAANFTYTTTLGAGQRINDGGDVDNIIATSHMTPLVHPNAVLIGERVYWALQNSGQIKEKYKYTGAGVVPTDIIKQVLNVNTLIVSRAKYDSSDPNAAASYGYIMGDDMLFFYLDPRPSMASLNTFWTFWYKEPGVGGQRATNSKAPYYIRAIRDDRKEGGGYYYDCESWHQPAFMMHSEASYLIKTAIT